MAGFRWGLASRGGSPFDCESCTDREGRNCLNRLDLSEDARAVTVYTDEVKAELGEKGAQKVFGLGGLRLYECPLSYISRDTTELMRLIYLMDGSGHLLHPGGWGEQPAWLVEAFEVHKLESARHLKGELK
ncbi:MAG: hypothetical protein V3W31_07900 [Thermodesulfobacteriota bacterium]